MSQHGDITRTITAHVIKHDLSAQEAAELYDNVLGAAEYNERDCDPANMVRMASYMITQKDGLYGVTHQQISAWVASKGPELAK